ncbi:MMPL family transporter [Actinomadura algeriensis]|uniref:Membrane protein YdfJ with MMPL/SSD domain n=1 Tax=Actinomadura algeriensis TaxID=1679523 RepID=A0ABR9JTK5_9ACTN|nr:MMPL family transporter [Actinomadura algeriensis]MBE1533902.1 putative membrane protein YdfJ with MMPL/SSD domain [Actinomadura algeriensis]
MTARLGAFCFRHRWKVITWVILAACAGLAAPLAGPVPQEHHRGWRLTATVTGIDGGADAATATLHGTMRDVARIPGVTRIRVSGPATGHDHVTLAVTLARSADDGAHDAAAARAAARLRRIGDTLPGARVRIGGDAWTALAARSARERDARRSKVVAVPVAIAVIAVSAGGAAAACTLVVAATAAAGIAQGARLGLGLLPGAPDGATPLVPLLAFALAAGHGLVLLARYREELVPAYREALVTGGGEVGRAARAEAVERAWHGTGRTVLFGAAAIVIPLIALVPLPSTVLRAVAADGASAAAGAALVSLTVTAALAAALGGRLRPSPGAVASPGFNGALSRVEAGRFNRAAAFAQRHPVRVGAAVAALQAPACVPLLTARTPDLWTVFRPAEHTGPSGESYALYGAVGAAVPLALGLLLFLAGRAPGPAIGAPLAVLLTAAAAVGATTVPHGSALDPVAVTAAAALAPGLALNYALCPLGRIREYRDGGAERRAAVLWGAQAGGRVVAVAALPMVVVAGTLATARTDVTAQFGTVLLIAGALDALLLRHLLLPALLAFRDRDRDPRRRLRRPRRARPDAPPGHLATVHELERGDDRPPRA